MNTPHSFKIQLIRDGFKAEHPQPQDGISRLTMHRCSSKHRSARAFVRCALKGCLNREIEGEGSFALIHTWRQGYTTWYRVTLFESREELAIEKVRQDRVHEKSSVGKCSGTCTGSPQGVEVGL